MITETIGECYERTKAESIKRTGEKCYGKRKKLHV